MIHGSSSFLFCFTCFTLDWMPLAWCTLSLTYLSGERPNMVLLPAVYPVTCCIPTHKLASISVCGDGCQGKTHTPLMPYRARELGEQVEWVTVRGHSGANNLRINRFVFKLSYLLTLESRGTASLSTFSQMLCLACVMVCHQSFLSVTVSIFLYFLHLLDDIPGHILSIWYIQENNCWHYEAPAWSVGYSL